MSKQEIKFGEFTDPRDGQTYPTVKIGNQVWFARNLNYVIIDSWHYKNDPANGNRCGRLYTYAAAIAACPKGWHLSKTQEWDNLIGAIGGEKNAGIKLKSTTGWKKGGNGTDDYGFSALPVGFRYSDGGFFDFGYYGYWWCLREGDANYTRRIQYSTNCIVESWYHTSYALSVRCVKD